MKMLREWGQIAGLVLTTLMIVSAVVAASQYFATKEELRTIQFVCQNYIDRSQDAQEKYLQEFIQNAANSAADKAVEKWISRTRVR